MSGTAELPEEIHGEAAGAGLAAPSLAIDLGAELARLRADDSWGRAGRHARTLVKDAELRVVLVALRAGARLEEHHAPGRITIQPLDGRLRVAATGRVVDLAPGELLSLGRAIPHAVEALEECAFLLTIAQPA
jgi:quercetin dioxygenase-like cupin family protein